MSRPDDPYGNSEERESGERIIDVSSREPMIVEDDERAPYFARGPERVRVYVASGGARTCVVPIALVLLLICCACAAFWIAADNFF
jgi:hypothetical protein